VIVQLLTPVVRHRTIEVDGREGHVIVFEDLIQTPEGPRTTGFVVEVGPMDAQMLSTIGRSLLAEGVKVAPRLVVAGRDEGGD
jgi:hypothetical protein